MSLQVVSWVIFECRVDSLSRSAKEWYVKRGQLKESNIIRQLKGE